MKTRYLMQNLCCVFFLMATGTIKIAEAGERTSALRRARVNTVFVRLMRWLLSSNPRGQRAGSVLGAGTHR